MLKRLRQQRHCGTHSACHAVALREGGHNVCSFVRCGNGETFSAQSHVRSRHLLSLPALQSSFGGESIRRGDDVDLSEVQPAHIRSAARRTGCRRAGLRRRCSAEADRKRIAARRSHGLYQSAHHPTASVAIASANIERPQSAARKRARATLTNATLDPSPSRTGIVRVRTRAATACHSERRRGIPQSEL